MRWDARELAAIFVGGATGTVARAELAVAWPTRTGDWPWATFAVNIVGAFLLGWLAVRLQSRVSAWPYWRPLVGVGLCGGLTTFSTMQVELLKMLSAGDIGLALVYAAITIVLGLSAVTAGTTLARRRRVSA